MFEFFDVECKLKNRRQEMQRLAAKKIHRPHRFQEDRRWRRHATFRNYIGDTLHEFDIFNGEGLRFRSNSEGMAETGSQIPPFFREVFLG